MTIVILIMGLVFAGVGFLIRAYPSIISGYNTMSDKRKKQIDIAGMSVYMCRWMVAIGVAVILVCLPLQLAGKEVVAGGLLMSIILFGSAMMLYGSRKFDGNIKKRWTHTATAATLAVLGAAIIFMLAWGVAPAKIVVESDGVRITGQYGTTINGAEISSVEVEENIPRIVARMNGLGMGSIKKGYFTVEGYGRTRLFYDASSEGPYIIITERSGMKTVYKSQSAQAAAADAAAIGALIKQGQQ